MSANEPSKALNHAGVAPALGKSVSVEAELRAPADPRLARRNRSLAGKFLPASASSREAVLNAILIAALSLPLAGCDILQSSTTTTSTTANLPLLTDTRGAQQLAAPPKPSEAPSPSKPAPPAPQPAPQPALRLSGTKPPPATATRGAEKLADPSPAAPVLTIEKTPLPPEPSAPPAPNTPVVAEASVTVTSAPVQSLIIRGSPPQAQSSWTGLKMLVALGLGLGVAALAVLGCLYMVRRAKPTELAATGKEELKMPRELLMKEPLNLPPEPMAVPEKS